MLFSGPPGKFPLTSLEVGKHGLFWQFHIPLFPRTDKDLFRPNATKRRAKDVHQSTYTPHVREYCKSVDFNEDGTSQGAKRQGLRN